ncbi:hydrolase [Halorhodospira halophila]|uniref:Alpha/beta hydrolase fold protein n=1 Tax=Halorhodospira halophila (strain DSM 244 / SL1) TaxID=349124 RepID=A1WYA7_HALHL|nr:hydrolase [Halorhodospira halophila]ABM62669.1 alpha/beta hydrolase fold protein [Halorhodospira halophila SL1]MBK1728350.1 hydrolase [Halorhodospira halophila]
MTRPEAAAFRPAWWLPGRHAQTVFPALLRTPPRPPLTPEVFELPDGDFLELAWGPPGQGLAIIGHGLGGSSDSAYVRGVVAELARRGIGSVVMQSRGAGRHPNRHRRSYHAAAWDDLEAVVAGLAERDPHRPLAVVGFSLSGSMLLNWLAERGDTPVARAVAVSVPFELDRCADALERGFARVYQAYLLRRLRVMAANKFAARDDSPVPAERIRRIRRLREFDNLLTAPLHGFRDSADYYRRASCRQRLSAIRQPTALLHAADDPFVPPETIAETAELGPGVTLELQRHGGHVGFVEGRQPGRPGYWLDGRIADLLEAALGNPPAGG